MSDLKNVTGKYLGRSLAAENDNWKKYKVQFQVGDKQWNFTCFTPWTKKDGSAKKGVSPLDLKEGAFYKIGYSTYQSEGMTHPSKTAVAFFEDKDGTQQTSMKPAVVKKIVDPQSEDVKKLVETYFKLKSVDEQNVNHFIGTLVRTLHEDEMKPLVEMFEANHKPVEEKEETKK